MRKQIHFSYMRLYHIMSPYHWHDENKYTSHAAYRYLVDSYQLFLFQLSINAFIKNIYEWWIIYLTHSVKTCNCIFFPGMCVRWNVQKNTFRLIWMPRSKVISAYFICANESAHILHIYCIFRHFWGFIHKLTCYL